MAEKELAVVEVKSSANTESGDGARGSGTGNEYFQHNTYVQNQIVNRGIYVQGSSNISIFTNAPSHPGPAPHHDHQPEQPSERPAIPSFIPRPPPEDIEKLHASTREIGQDQLQYLCRQIGGHWRRLGRTLGHSDPEIETLEMDFKGTGMNEVVYQEFCLWKQKKGAHATFQALALVFKEMERNDLVKTLAVLLEKAVYSDERKVSVSGCT